MISSLRCAAIGVAALILLLGTDALRAQDVTLSSRDGGIELSGTLLGYDGEFYRVDSDFGILTLAAEGVTCTGPGCPDLTSFVAEFTIAGAPAIGTALVPALIKGFAAEQGLALHVEQADGARLFKLSDAVTHAPVARITLILSSSDEGLVSLLAGEADIALSFSELRDEDVRAFVVALDAFVPVVGRGNPIKRMTMQDLAAVMSGEIDSWAELGWLDVPIRVHARNTGSGEQQALEALLLAPLDLPMAPDAQRHASEPAFLDAVARDPFAIGVALRSDTGVGARLELHGACGLTLPATPLAIKAEDYPLTVPLLMHTRAERQPLQVRRFMTHIAGESAQETVRDAGFVDQSPHAVGLDAQGRRLVNAILAAGDDVGLDELQRLARAMEPSERLSTTFRFESGTTRLDVQSRGNVRALARDLEAGRHDGRTVVFAGFTDSEGPAEVNRDLAQQRAETVRDAVRAAAPLRDAAQVELEAEGFGEAMPMACEDSEWGRQVNRRVEVWLR